MVERGIIVEDFVLDVDSVRRGLAVPLGEAKGLPSSLYVSPDGFSYECSNLFPRQWSCLASMSDVPRVGDALPIDFCGLPLFLLRTSEDEVRVFHNVCLHRGMHLVHCKKRVKGALTCPYHAWSYDFSGKLLKTPKVVGDEDGCGLSGRDSMGLREVSSYVWMETIFINLDGCAESFPVHHADLLSRWSEYESVSLWHSGEQSHFELELRCNWKLAVENYCESYHLPWVHPGLNSYSRIEDHYHIESDLYSGQGTTVYAPNFGDSALSFPNHVGLSSKWDSGAEYVALYPNVLLGIHRDHFYTIRIEPISCSETREVIDIYYFSESAAFGDEYSGVRDANRDLWRGIFLEDVFAVEGMQRGRHSPAFVGGRFVPSMDGPTHCFHRWVGDNLV